MPDAMTECACEPSGPEDHRIYGVALAKVLMPHVLDPTLVQVEYTWMPGVRPWARIAAPSAGLMHGTYFMPMPGSEVLVGFHHGDINEPFILGCLWGMVDRPPVVNPLAPLNERTIKTPVGNQILFTEVPPAVTIGGMMVRITSPPVTFPIPAFVDGFTYMTGTMVELRLGENSLTITPAGISLKAGGNVIEMTPGGIQIHSPSLVSVTAPAPGGIRLN